MKDTKKPDKSNAKPDKDLTRLFVYDPKPVDDDVLFQSYAYSKMVPADLADPDRQKAYQAYLDKNKK